MLRKRTRSNQKVQHMNHLVPDGIISESFFLSDNLSQKHKTNSFFNVPGLFVGFNPRSSESDSVRSPTSPLDFKIFSSFGNPFRCGKSQNEGYHKSWDCNKVGLSIVDSLDDENKQSGKVLRSCDCKNTVFGRQISVKSSDFCSSHEKHNSLPKNIAVFPNTEDKTANTKGKVVFEIGEAPFEPNSYEKFRACSFDSVGYRSKLNDLGNSKSRLGSGNLAPESSLKPISSESKFLVESLKLGNSFGVKLGSIPPSSLSGAGFNGDLLESDIDLSEFYTCVRTHGPNPKVTHIFGDCILESHNDEVTHFSSNSEDGIPIHDGSGSVNIFDSYPPHDFLKFCCSCQKKLDGEDIYMYRGEKAFCSYSCRSKEIEMDEEMEEANNNSSDLPDKPKQFPRDIKQHPVHYIGRSTLPVVIDETIAGDYCPRQNLLSLRAVSVSLYQPWMIVVWTCISC